MNSPGDNVFTIAPSAAPIEPRGTIELFGSILSYITLFFLLFGIAGTIEVQQLRRQMKKFSSLLTGLFAQFFLLPCLGFISILIFNKNGLTYAQSMTLIIVTSSPGGSFSNLWCSLFNADLSLSIAMTSFSSALGIGFLPANLALYTEAARRVGVVSSSAGTVTKSIDFKGLAASLGIVVAGVILGLTASHMFGRKFRRIAHVTGSISGLALIALSAIFATVGNKGNAKPWNQKTGFYIGVGFPSVVGLLASIAISALMCNKISKPEVMTIAIESAFQNIAIAASAAFNIFSTKTETAEALCVPVMYGAITTLGTTIFCIIAWKIGWSKAPRNESFLRILTTSYETITEDIEDVLTMYSRIALSTQVTESKIKNRRSSINVDAVAIPHQFSPRSRLSSVSFGGEPRLSWEDQRLTTLDMTFYFFDSFPDDSNTDDEWGDESVYSTNDSEMEKSQPIYFTVEQQSNNNSRWCIGSPKDSSNDVTYVRLDSENHSDICTSIVQSPGVFEIS